MVNALSFQLKKQIYSKFWDAERNLVLETFSEARSINDYLTLVKADILRYYNILLSTKDVVTAWDVKNSYKGVKEIKKTFLQLFNQTCSKGAVFKYHGCFTIRCNPNHRHHNDSCWICSLTIETQSRPNGCHKLSSFSIAISSIRSIS